MDKVNDEFINGYMDGLDLNNPQPSNNRHPAYVHSFNVARAELENKPIPADISRKKAELILKETKNDYMD